MRYKIVVVLIFLSAIFLRGEIRYSHSGYFGAATIHRLSDGSIIKMPYRIFSYEPVFSLNDFNIVANTALEFRLKDLDKIMESNLTIDLRELYIEWMTPLGDFSIGKQIIIWGSASENNTTDNISPYNYYYLFSMGKERKEGVMSLNSNIYLGNIKLNGVIIPQHNSSILPLNDPEFTISSPIVPKDEQIMGLNNPYEYGLLVNFPFSSMDITTSYYSGYDRILSFFGANVWSDANENPSTIIPDTVLSYRKTDIYGFGFSSFIGEFVIRGDFGYFNTDDNIILSGDSTLYRDWPEGRQTIIERCEEKNETLSWDLDFQKIDCQNEPHFNNSFVLDNHAKYQQYTIEIEFSPGYDINLITQISKHKLVDIGRADSLNVSTGTIMLDPREFFIPGMGTPNTFISSNALSISAQKFFPDVGLELRYFTMFDLDKKGSLHELGIEYEINENMNILIAMNKIIDNKNIEMNPFTGMEDFSHIRLELKYFY